MLEEPESAKGGLEVASGTYNRHKIDFVARRVIVKIARPDGDVSVEDVQERVRSAAADGSQVLREPGASGRMVLLLPEGESVPQWAKRLDADASVEYAEPDVVDRAQIVPNDSRYPGQWAPKKVNAEAAWDLETGKSNVVIGIIYSGISMTGAALDHDDLSTPGRITLGTDYVDGGTPRDLNGHGTHVAGIAGGAGNNAAGIAGMNWGSPLYICRTLDANGNGSSADFADAVEEITDYAVANGLKAVINYSGGGGNNTTKQQACQYASDRGMLVVAAAGNDSGDPVIWPAAYSTTITGVVAVGSTDSNDAVSSFSNVGPEITVVAPGRNIDSTTPTYQVRPTLPVNYGLMSGTSMATPMVSGLAALMWSRHPSHTHAKIKQCLQDTAIKLGSGTFDNAWGHGRVDAHAALKCGDLVIMPSTIKVTCPDLKSRLVVCLPPTAVCPKTRVSTQCPSKLPVLCPTTGLTGCWSRLACVEPTTSLAGCGPRATAICPSAVDACPSAPGGCLDPGRPVVIDPRVLGRLGAVEARLDALERDLSEAFAEAEIDEDVGPDGWFYVDDDGEAHEI